MLLLTRQLLLCDGKRACAMTMTIAHLANNSARMLFGEEDALGELVKELSSRGQLAHEKRGRRRLKHLVQPDDVGVSGQRMHHRHLVVDLRVPNR